MNSFIVMAEIVKDPQLRYTQENQTPIAEMLVQFPALRAEDPPATLKVVGWGNLAQEICDRYREGDRVVIEGRLSMNTVDRPEGFKEKRAELTASRIHSLKPEELMSAAPAPKNPPSNVVSISSRNQPEKAPRWSEPPAKSEPANTGYSAPPAKSKTPPPPPPQESEPFVRNEPSQDDIPF